jgi:2'-5' RNA ligase superfamily protein
MKRSQLTLFILGEIGERIDRIRKIVDPIQAALIAPHLTLCREDELQGITPAMISARLSGQVMISLQFGRPEISDGHGLLLRCVSREEQFAQLRRQLLGIDARPLGPHITLAHPRNPRSVGNSLGVVDLEFPLEIRFARVTLIEQEIPGQAWTRVTEFALAEPVAAVRERPAHPRNSSARQ